MCLIFERIIPTHKKDASIFQRVTNLNDLWDKKDCGYWLLSIK
jgi:hypothetical protein